MSEHDRDLEREAEWRWGNTEAYTQSRGRTERYSAEDWKRFHAEQQTLNGLSARLMREGTAPDSAEAMAAAELHRQLIDTWFYDCSPAMHAMLAEGYVTDERFKATYEAIAPGLASFHAASIKANAEAQGVRTAIDDALGALKQSMGLGAPDADPISPSSMANKALSKRERKAQQKAERQARKKR